LGVKFCRGGMMRRFLFWSPIVLGVIFLLLLGYHRRAQAFAGQNDFTTFYAGGKLAGTGQLYSRAANVELTSGWWGRIWG